MYLLRLFITGKKGKSQEAIESLQSLCEKRWPGAYCLDIIDILEMPEKAKEEQILITPVLLKIEPQPSKRIVGDFSNPQEVLTQLEEGGLNENDR